MNQIKNAVNNIMEDLEGFSKEGCSRILKEVQVELDKNE